MPETYRYIVHAKGPALWPEHKSEKEVRELEATTPPDIFSATYQGDPTPPGGTIFKRAWWNDPARRFNAGDPMLSRTAVARWLSFDTAMKEKQTSDFTACCVTELRPDYRVTVNHAWQERIEFPELHERIIEEAERANRDHKLRGIIIEDKGSGISVLQTLRAAAPAWIGPLLVPFTPHNEKQVRWKQVSVWCKQGCVLLPLPNEHAPWLIDLEDQLLKAPGGAHDDMVDAFSQSLLYLEHLLAAGLAARGGAVQSPEEDEEETEAIT